ncbi:hypothetical protein JCM10908_000194 [Rhodotorula pacifica]|uniref:uncharacterized protein n=1 Tax=Rhodotorula pacifica TaxID=1495444 RepID=UPI00317FCB00
MPLPEVLNREIADPFDELSGRRNAAADAAQLDGPPPPPAVIRPFNAKTDLKLVRYLVGAVVMEPSSLANQAALFKPVSLVAWLAVTHFLIIRFTSGYPAFVHDRLWPDNPKVFQAGAASLSPVWEIVTLLPVIVAPIIAILAAFEWRHRNLFEAEMRRTIGEEDMRDIAKYYGVENQGGAREVGKEAKKGDTPRQRHGFWVLEFDNRMLGAVGLDGRKPGQPLESVVDQIDKPASSKKSETDESASKSLAPETASTSAVEKTTAGASIRNRAGDQKAGETPSVSVTPPTPSSGSEPQPYTLDSASTLPDGTLHLRRFGTSLSFRPAGIDDDLLQHVAKVAFSPSTSADEPEPAQQIVFQLRPTAQKSLRRTLERNGWELVPKGSELEVSPNAAAIRTNKSVVDPIWPLDLSERTMVLRRSSWERRQAQ